MQGTNHVETICRHICALGEGPIWNPRQLKLYWTDIPQGTLWVYDEEEKTCGVFWQGDCRVGGFAFTQKDDLVLCTDKGVLLLEKENSYRNPPRLLFEIPFRKEELFNDIIVDPRGRIFAGTLERQDYDGRLYRLEKGKEPVVILKNLKCSNGMAFSPDNQSFYHTDSLIHRITRYRYDIQTGEIWEPVPFYQGDKDAGLPDGMTIDEEGHIWSAFWGSHTVRRFNPSGEMVQEVRFPAQKVTSVIFGGSQMDRAFVTSASQGAQDPATGYSREGMFMGGPTYMFAPGVKGRPEELADF